MWTLGVVEEMGYPDKQCNVNRILPTEYPFKGLEVDPRPFFEFPFKYRTEGDFLVQTDFYYRLEWAVMDALKRDEELEELHPLVVYERHYALQWVMSRMEWDDVKW